MEPLQKGSMDRPNSLRSREYGHGYTFAMRSISAGKFKDTCLRILDEVAAGRAPVVITKWGRPVARLVPVMAQRPRPGAGAEPADRVEEPIRPYGSDHATRDGGDQETHRLHRLAAERGVSPDSLLRQALDAYVGDGALADLIERAKRPVGAFRSGDRHTARDHDAALDEIWMDWRRK